VDDDVFISSRQPILIDWPPRPPEERRRRFDWRFVVGGLGRVLIAAGLLLFGFVAYQLWGTGIQQARSQDRLQDRFAALVGQPATSAGASTTVAGPALTAITTGSVPPQTASTAATLAPATTAATAPPEPGDPVARLVVPAIGIDQVIVSGVGLDELKKGPGHYPDTPLPGEIGNAAIAGHRSTFGAPFARVDELERGDEIDVTRPDGTRYVYRVVDWRIVEPTEVSVIANTPDAQLTLTSCWPKFSAAKRIVVRAVLDSSSGAPAVLPTSTTAPTAPSTTATAAVATTQLAGGTVPPDTTTTPDTTAAPAATSASVDAFQQGWWADDAAWGDVIAWGSALSAVALAAWMISRRTRHNWIGALVGIVPFVVLLYFFYENAARLLPPNI
jgi:sortase A